MFTSLGTAFFLTSLTIGLAAVYVAVERRRILAEVEQSVRERTGLVRAAAHELRQPLTTIVGLVEHLRTSVEGASGDAKTADRIQESIHELDGALDNTLEIFDLAGGQLSLQKEAIELRTETILLIRRINKRLLSQKKPVLVQADHLPECWVEADLSKVQKCLMTLVEQAIYQTTHGQVNVSFRVSRVLAERHEVLFTVSDDGPGMDPHLAKHFFDPLGYANNPALKGRPAAMLAINLAHQVAEKIGGSVRAESRVGVGTCFTFAFEALSCPPPSPPEADDVIVVREPAQLPNLTDLSVLLVDDHQLNLFVLEELIVPLGFGQVVSVRSGEQAIQRASQETFDLILLDIAMPGADGFDVAQSVRQSGQSVNCQIVAVSADHRYQDDPDLHQVGVQAFLPKPIVPSDLMACIAKLAPVMQREAAAREYLVESRYAKTG